MLKIGDFSKLSHITVKALRFYEKEGLLCPVKVDQWTGYRFYETAQLDTAARIKAYRQLDLSIEEIKAIFAGASAAEILRERAALLEQQRSEIDVRLNLIHFILEDKNMKYQVTEKVIPAATVYYSEVRLPKYADIMEVIPALGAECLALNPDLKCAEPAYEFCEYPEEENREENVLIRHNEAVERAGKEGGRIRFRTIPETKVLSVYHKGAYENIGAAYSFLLKYAEENGYRRTGPARECYIDGIWNKETVEEWLTELQLPIE